MLFGNGKAHTNIADDPNMLLSYNRLKRLIVLNSLFKFAKKIEITIQHIRLPQSFVQISPNLERRSR